MSCSDYPTAQTAKAFKLDAETTNEVVTLGQDRTSAASDGKTKKTFWGIENDATLQRENIDDLAEQQRENIETTFTAQFAYKRIGNISLYVGDSIPEPEKLNSYQYPDNSGEWYGPAQDQVFPITIPADPSDDNDWALVNALTSDSLPLYTDIVYKASGGNSAVENMIAGNPTSSKVNDKIQTEDMLWQRVSLANNDITDFKSIGDVSMLAFGYGITGNTPEENYDRLVEINNWLSSQDSVGTIKHPSNAVSFKTTIPNGTTKQLGSDIASLRSFILDFNGGKMIDETDVSIADNQLVLFVVRDAKTVKFINSDIEGQMPIPETSRRGTTLCRAYNADYAEFNGTSTGMLNNLETRFCKVVINKGAFTRVRYPFLTFNCGQFDYDAVTEDCWRDFFVQGGSGEINCTSERPHQHSLLKSYNSTQALENISGYYKARNRPSPIVATGQVGLEIQSDEMAIFRNIDLDVDIEGEYERPFMLRNFKSNGDDQDAAKGHVLQNVKFSGRYKNTTTNTGNLFVAGGGYRDGDYIQNFSFNDLTVVGSFVINLNELIPAIDSSNKMKWKNLTITDAFLQNHDQGFYAPYLRVENVNFPGKAYSSNGVQECGVLKFTKKYVGNLSSGVSLFTTDSSKTFNQVVVNYCATNSESTFNPFAEGRLSGLVVYPSSGSAAEFVVDTQFSKSGTVGVADLYEVSSGVFGFRIPEWTSATTGMVQIDAVVNYSSYGEDDFSSIPGLVYEPYKSL